MEMMKECHMLIRVIEQGSTIEDAVKFYNRRDLNKVEVIMTKRECDGNVWSAEYEVYGNEIYSLENFLNEICTHDKSSVLVFMAKRVGYVREKVSGMTQYNIKSQEPKIEQVMIDW